MAQDRPFRPSYAQPGVSPGGRFSVVRYGSVVDGNVTRIVELSNGHGVTLAEARPQAGTAAPRLFSAMAADGVTRLHGVLFFPADFDETKRYPLIDYIYPGPQTQYQPQFFGSAIASFAQSLAELGFVTTVFDTRCLPFRSRALHQVGYGQFLEPQLADHAAVVRQLCERHAFLDGDRIGMIGASGGGLATARALFDYGDIFKVGVSVCGNHDSRILYSQWSDKYRGRGNRESWAGQPNSDAAHKLTGKLFLISGDMDENVPVSQTLRLADALVRANKDFDMLIVPCAGHSVMQDNGYTLRRIWDYLLRHLLGETPPVGFDLRFEPHEVASLTASFLRDFQ